MSVLAWIVLAILWLAVFISLFVAIGGKLSWLNFLYVFSYVKLVVTLIKYIPQVGVATVYYTSSSFIFCDVVLTHLYYIGVVQTVCLGNPSVF